MKKLKQMFLCSLILSSSLCLPGQQRSWSEVVKGYEKYLVAPLVLAALTLIGRYLYRMVQSRKQEGDEAVLNLGNGENGAGDESRAATSGEVTLLSELTRGSEVYQLEKDGEKISVTRNSRQIIEFTLLSEAVQGHLFFSQLENMPFAFVYILLIGYRDRCQWIRLYKYSVTKDGSSSEKFGLFLGYVRELTEQDVIESLASRVYHIDPKLQTLIGERIKSLVNLQPSPLPIQFKSDTPGQY